MKTRVFTLKKTAAALSLFLSIFLMAFSCDDHVVPETPKSPEIQTLDLNVNSNSVIFKVVFPKLGEIPVIEYGTLYRVAGFGSSGIIPTEADEKTIFSAPISQLTLSQEQFLLSNENRIFYRAYAKLGNGTTIFGDVKTSILSSE